MTIDEPKETLPEIAAENQDAINARRYKALIITGICLPLMLYPYLGHLFLIYNNDYLFRLIASEVLKWMVLAIVYFYARKAELNSFLLWPQQKYNAAFYIKFVILLYLLVLGCGVIAHIPTWLGFHDDNSIMLKMNGIIQRYPLLLVCVCLNAGISEELIFRGYILSRLSLFFPDKHWPVFISALIFTSVHLAYKNLGEVLFVFLFALVFGYHYQKYRNLTVLMIVHFITDLIAIGLYHHHK